MVVSALPEDGLQHGRGYPRPQLRRANWQSLNGIWEFALDPACGFKSPGDVVWDGTIIVPFAPEAPASGRQDLGFFRACWYRHSLPLSALPDERRVLLHCGAVDYEAVVWINGVEAGRHEGGYTPFTVDITRHLSNRPQQDIVVRAYDDPGDLTQPRGKQDWQLQPHAIWYPRTTGIWQTVWYEIVSATHIQSLRWTPNLKRWELGLEAAIAGGFGAALRLHVHLSVGDLVIADDSYSVTNNEVHRRIALSDPGIDDYRNELLWSPESPTLIAAQLELWNDTGQRLDAVSSYTAIRSVTTQHDRFILNGRPYYMRLVLDQGYWPDSGLTAPDDAALKRDVELAKALGFNGVRKHQKVEDPRYLYWADRLGLIVWGEMPSAYRFTRRSIERVVREWAEVIERDYSHPCIVTWVPFNESWGAPNLPDSATERHYVASLYHLTRTLDSTRTVVGNDGWESVATDIIGIHDYDADTSRIARRYHADEMLPRLFRRERPGGRLLLVGEQTQPDQPIVLSEFGGIACPVSPGTWGYSRCETPESFGRQYSLLLSVVRSLAVLSGFCYTQFTDTYQEANGLLYADRTPKVALAILQNATRGPQPGQRPVEPLEAVGLKDRAE
jgi:hypothetical protein